jgi:hypothetical protein
MGIQSLVFWQVMPTKSLESSQDMPEMGISPINGTLGFLKSNSFKRN